MGIELLYMLPLILASFFSISAIVIDALLQNKKFSYSYSLIGLIIIGISSVYCMSLNPAAINALGYAKLMTKNMISFKQFPLFFDIIFSISGILTILASKEYIKNNYKELNEYYSLILFSVSGMMLIAHANSMLILFIGIEIMSISFYILAGYFRNSNRSIEAALKYFLLGSFATGFLIYGMSLIYGATNSLDFTIINIRTTQLLFNNTFFVIGLGLIVIGLSFKVAAFPFHQWAPDVYEGSPTNVTGFMSTAGKAAAMAAFIIIGRTFMPSAVTNELIIHNTKLFQTIIAVIAALTMIIGNLTAISQKSVKRMLAYSSVAHAGYMLIGIASNNTTGWQGIMFYSTAYLFMQIGAFIVISVLEKENGQHLEIDDYAGLSKTHPMLALFMSMFMLSLAGIPPFAGFFGKYYLFVSAIKSDMVWLTILAVIASIISMYFYIGLILQMYFKDAKSENQTIISKTHIFALVICISGILIFGLFPSLLTDYFFSIFG